MPGFARSVAVALVFALIASVTTAQQNAALRGTVTDESKAVLPGVTVTAADVTSGVQQVTVTNERGEYAFGSLPPGRYALLAELSGFSAARVQEFELLVGQNATLPLTLKVGTLEESITVTSEPALIDLHSSQVAGNIDRRQMEALPLQGRNWMELAMIVKGITANDVADRPGVLRDTQFQLNLDGQQITQSVASSGFGQPRFSREAIAEFQVVTNQFEITQGRSIGIQVQAVSRSGTNKLSGSTYGYFRDDNLNAKDPIANRVLPYSNQQAGFTLGGPIKRDVLHYFFSYENEREPNTLLTAPPSLPSQSFAFPTKLTQNSLLGRVDWALSGRDRATVRSSYWDWENPFFLANGTTHPSQAAIRTRNAINTVATWSRIMSSTTLQELKFGWSHFDWKNLLAVPALASTPNYVLPNLTVGQLRNYPQEFFQNTWSLRYDLNLHRSSHDLKIGGEFLRWHDTGQWQLLSRGEFVFNTSPPDLEARFPAEAWNDPTHWNLTGLDSRVQRFDQNYGDWTIDIPRPTWAIWLGDAWMVHNRLTLNLGIRWDDDIGVLDPPYVNQPATFNPSGPTPIESSVIAPGAQLYPGGLRDHSNISPRVGFTWNVTGRNDFAIRGGSGLYFAVPDSNTTFSQQSFNGSRIIVNSFPNDGQPGFIQDPTRGRTPQDFFDGKYPLPPQSPRVIAHDYKMPYTWQSSIGFQKQLVEGTSVETDFTHWNAHNLGDQRDLNLLYNAATGYAINPNTRRADPNFGVIQWLESRGRADNAALASALHRRFSSNLQATLTYTLMFFAHDDTTGFQYQPNNHFAREAEWARSTDFQRHTVRATAIYRLPWAVSVSGAYFYGSGNYYATTIALNPFGTGAGSNRFNSGAPLTIPAGVADRFDGPTTIATGEVAPRNALRGLPLHKVDARVAKDVHVRAVTITGIAEVFNLFNHKNYGAYNGQINSTTFGEVRQNVANSYFPRTAQLAFRVSF
jgi:Carboxypeptidase regulatory-like domain